MRRLTATLLLLFALAGNIVPLALAATADPPHACCIRKAVHPCHGAASTESESLEIRRAACCNRDCCRATAARWAQTQVHLATLATPGVNARALSPYPNRHCANLLASRSTRAPPALLSSLTT